MEIIFLVQVNELVKLNLANSDKCYRLLKDFGLGLDLIQVIDYTLNLIFFKIRLYSRLQEKEIN